MEAFDVPEFIMDSTRVVKFKRREVFIRVLGILIISFLSTLDERIFELWSGKFWIIFLIELITISLIWNGSMFVIQYCFTKISIFKEPVKLITIQILLLTILVIAVVMFSYYLAAYLLNVEVKFTEVKGSIFRSLLITLLISSIYATVGFFLQWKENLLKAQHFERASLEAKYETLKNQVNPHFVFNSLNTLLTMVECNPEAVTYVESLSDFLRYVLQTREKEAVLLRDELSMAKQYINIQKGRFSDKLKIIVDVPESYYHYAIPPLVLQMLLENAIKHNVIGKDNVLEIDVYIAEKEYLVVENKVNLKEDIETSTGIGLNNIKSRYLFFSGKEVVISQDDGIFRVMLPLIEYKL